MRPNELPGDRLAVRVSPAPCPMNPAIQQPNQSAVDCRASLPPDGRQVPAMNGRLTAEQIYYAAREKSDPAARAGYLEGACGRDVALRARVEALLKADAEAGSFLKGPE